MMTTIPTIDRYLFLPCPFSSVLHIFTVHIAHHPYGAEHYRQTTNTLQDSRRSISTIAETSNSPSSPPSPSASTSEAHASARGSDRAPAQPSQIVSDTMIAPPRARHHAHISRGLILGFVLALLLSLIGATVTALMFKRWLHKRRKRRSKILGLDIDQDQSPRRPQQQDRPPPKTTTSGETQESGESQKSSKTQKSREAERGRRTARIPAACKRARPLESESERGRARIRTGDGAATLDSPRPELVPLPPSSSPAKSHIDDRDLRTLSLDGSAEENDRGRGPSGTRAKTGTPRLDPMRPELIPLPSDSLSATSDIDDTEQRTPQRNEKTPKEGQEGIRPGFGTDAGAAASKFNRYRDTKSMP